MFTNNPKQLAKAKLLLLYIIDKIELPISNSYLTQIVLESDIMDYFMLQQYLSELKDSKFIAEEINDEKHLITITNMGKNTLGYFINRIPNTQIKHINKIVDIHKQKIIQNTQVSANFTKLKENEYLVRLKVIENNLPIINLELSVTNNKQAKEICKKWRSNASHFYSQIIKMFMT